LVFVLARAGYPRSINVSGARNVFFARPDGSGMYPITTNGLLGFIEIRGISPDRKRLLLQSSPDQFMRGASYLYIASIDGSGVTKLAAANNVNNALWLQRADKIAYSDENHIYLLDPDEKTITTDRWEKPAGFFPYRVQYEFEDTVIFTTARGAPGRSIRDDSCISQAMKTDGSGKVTPLNVSFDFTVSPDKTRVIHGFGTGNTTIFWIASIRKQGDSVVIDTSQEKQVPVDITGSITTVWSPDSSFLWIHQMIGDGVLQKRFWRNGDQTENRFYIWKIGEQQARQITKLTEKNPDWGYPMFGDWAISPDGKRVLFTHGGNYIAVFDLENDQVSLEFGCAIRGACPPEPTPVMGGQNYWKFLESVAFGSPIWIPI
jgi:hypothetical protein